MTQNSGCFDWEVKKDEKTGSISHELNRLESHLLPKAGREGVPVCLSFAGKKRESGDTHYLACAMQSGVIHVLSGFSLKVETTIEKTFIDPNDSKSPVTSLQTSSDGNWLACIRNGGDISIYNLQTLELHTQIPMALLGNSKPCACGFHKADNNNLVIVCNDNRFYVYSVAERQISNWSAANSEKIPAGEYLYRLLL
uniref:Anaphase-promoting complex subunit 4 WD40 domain-containing protein n=1 Tax=Aplanochytrium stocchinoi TaxID=215587 RepID=A0A7S3LP85_9STRA